MLINLKTDAVLNQPIFCEFTAILNQNEPVQEYI